MEDKVYKGRRKIYSSIVPDVNTVPDIINKALLLHAENETEIRYLIDYTLGDQPILKRTKEVRSDINNKIVVNHAWESVRDITGYFMGSPVQYSLKTGDKRDQIQHLNNCMDYESRSTIDKIIEDFASICGIGYKCTLYDKVQLNDVPFNLSALSPINTFCVYSTKIGNPMVLSVNKFNYTDENDRAMTRYVAYTDTHSYELVAPTGVSLTTDYYVTAPTPHYLGSNPIVPYENNQWLMGDFETCLTLLDAINTVASNSVDDVEQVIQAILVFFGIPPENHQDLIDTKTGDVLCFSGTQGINQDGKYITASLDSSAVADLRTYLEESYRLIIGIPDRKTRGGGGGDTGDAVKLRDGWADMEIVARGKEMFWKKAEMQSLKVALNILKSEGQISDLTLMDIDIKCNRNKNDNLQSKVQAGSTLYSMGVAKVDVATAMDITTDIAEFVNRWDQAEEEDRRIQQEMFMSQDTDDPEADNTNTNKSNKTDKKSDNNKNKQFTNKNKNV